MINTKINSSTFLERNHRYTSNCEFSRQGCSWNIPSIRLEGNDFLHWNRRNMNDLKKKIFNPHDKWRVNCSFPLTRRKKSFTSDSKYFQQIPRILSSGGRTSKLLQFKAQISSEKRGNWRYLFLTHELSSLIAYTSSGKASKVWVITEFLRPLPYLDIQMYVNT